MSPQELEEQKDRVYRASITLIDIQGLDVFIEYLQQVEEMDIIPSSITLDKATYVQVLRLAIKDYRDKLFKS